MNLISEIKLTYVNRTDSKCKVASSSDAYSLFLADWDMEIIQLQEEFKIMMLNRVNQVLGIYPMSKGGVAGTVVDLRLIFTAAIKCNACAMVLAHNHPSGSLKPSKEDIALTKKIIITADLFEISIHDHLIITGDSYYSFSDDGNM
jgi:DNA repair protein RadC